MSNESKIASERQNRRTSVTASMIESAATADAFRERVHAFVGQEKFDVERFPLISKMVYKLEAGMKVKPEIESNLWFVYVNKVLGGFGEHVERPLRQRVARELCEAALREIQDTGMEEFKQVLAAKKDEREPVEHEVEVDDALPSVTEVYLSLIGSKIEFDQDLVNKIEEVEKDVKLEDGSKVSFQAKVLDYQISSALTEAQIEQGLEREIVVICQVPREHADKFVKAIKSKAKGFKVEQIDEKRAPKTQGKEEVAVMAAANKQMLDSYLETALWSSMDNSNEQGGDPLDSNYDFEDIDAETLKQADKDCEEFEAKAGALLDSLDMAQVGHDFWLTRNRHGAGFWDGDYEKEIGEKLTELSHEFGEVDLYVGDDNKIYSSLNQVKAEATEAPVSDEKKVKAAGSTTFFANPYGDGEGFYFKDMSEYEEGMKKLEAQGLEEVEIDFIDGDGSELFEALKLNQGNINMWFDEIESLNEEEKAILYFETSNLGVSVDDALYNAQRGERQVSKTNLEDYAYDMLKETYPEIMDGPLGNYIDYKGYARDLQLSGDMTEFEYDGDTWVADNH